MKLGFELPIEQKQTLVMTPELIQAIQILQYNTQELDAYVEEQLLANPILELAPADASPEEKSDEAAEGEDGTRVAAKDKAKEDFDWSEYLKEREYDDISYRQIEASGASSWDGNEYTFEQFTSKEITLSEHLMFQLQFTDLSGGRRQIGKYIIESLDRNGSLTQTAEEIAAQLKVPAEKVKHVIGVIQTFEPTGVCASDLRECLLIQLDALGIDDPKIRVIVDEYLEDLAANRLGHIAKAVGVSVHEVQNIADVIKGLEPKPGRPFSSGTDTKYIVPDVIVEKTNGEYVVTVNETGIPKLLISPYYRKILSSADKDSGISQFLAGRLNSALWLIKSIEQRSQTIYNVVSAVVNHQVHFFEHGEKHLKPLTLKKIADDIGIHESTVSRSISGKYMQTPRGVFEIKYFFTSGVSDGSAEGMASGSIKALIREIVAAEDPASPLSDQSITEKLRARGIEISRRTIVKYRDEMGILSSSKRRRY
ncbi:MAG: RNA polymerase factor sigma-54 [Clostridiales Family XIII bacterium]|jgi:RNA polymerase sigma-54 factor|nr:RNA polymerase factor sigma-54 [Clostridiales Family XIII bacterium]